MTRRRGLRIAGSLLLASLIACEVAGRPDPAMGDPSLPEPSKAGFAARGVRYGFTTERGERREIEVDAVGALPGRVLGLRIPLLDGLVLEGIRIVEGGTVVKSISRLAIDPFAATMSWRRSGGAPPEVLALAESLASVVGRGPAPKRSVSPRSQPTAGSAGRGRASASRGRQRR